MERRPDGTLLFRLGQPLHQIITVLLVAVSIAAVFFYGALSNEKPLEFGGEIWADARIVNIVFGVFGFIAFAIGLPVVFALRARLDGRQSVRLEARRIVLDGLHRSGMIQMQYSDVITTRLASAGLNKYVEVSAKDGTKMTIPVLIFLDQTDPERLLGHLDARLQR